ncbi:MAG: PilZ domain-containing protein [Prochlorococcaceae cyanobacterium]
MQRSSRQWVTQFGFFVKRSLLELGQDLYDDSQSALRKVEDRPNKLLRLLNQDIGTLFSKNTAATCASVAKAKRSPRHLAPLGASAITGELISSEGKAMTVTLWNLSESGFCVVVQWPLPLQLEHPLSISFQDSAGTGQLRVFATMRWSHRVAGTTFAGLRLTSPTSVLRQSFLGAYLKPRV